MATFKEVLPSIDAAATYELPFEPFPDAHALLTDFGRLRGYVEDRLIKLAESGDLFITDIFQHNQAVVRAAGMIILGHHDSDDGPITVEPDSIPEELNNYRVRIVSMPERDVRRAAPDDDGNRTKTLPKVTIKYKATPKVLDATARGRRPGTASSAKLLAERIMDSGSYDDTFTVQQAWHILRQQGEFCKLAPDAFGRATQWLYREVRPTKKKKPGRPKGS